MGQGRPSAVTRDMAAFFPRSLARLRLILETWFVTLGFLLSLVLLASVGLVSYRSTMDLVLAATWKTHTIEVVGAFRDLLARLYRVESDVRGYILTGETIRDRTLLNPLSPFDLRKGRCGTGAWEVTARYSELNLDSRVFTAGLADPKLWTNRAQMVDVGCNWYLNQFVKVYFDWEHAIFGNPVFSSPGRFHESNDLFWIRTQVYF